MLILAGISINLVLGDNGIINKAKIAQSEMAVEQAREYLQMAVVNINIKNDVSDDSSENTLYATKESFMNNSDFDSKQYEIEEYEKIGELVKIKLKKNNDIFLFVVNTNTSSVEKYEKVSCEVGDYVRYPIEYENYSPTDSRYGTKESLRGWRVLSIDENNNPTKLISAGIPTEANSMNNHLEVYQNLVTNFSTQLGELYLDSDYASNVRSITLEDVASILDIKYFKTDEWLLKDLSNNSSAFGNYNDKKRNLLELKCSYFLASDFTHSSNTTGGMYYYHAGSKQIYYAGNYTLLGVRVVVDLKPNIQAYKTTQNTGINQDTPYLLMY